MFIDPAGIPFAQGKRETGEGSPKAKDEQRNGSSFTS
jgi:hypothetical protein